jgi:nicotinate-nucleotide adenylyltransferase
MVQAAKKRKKIGLLGGTFDPVHNGHLAVANHVRHALKLDSIWFIPAARPPHKAGHADGREISGFAHRIAMLEGALAGNSTFVISDIEAKRNSPSYSIDTIKLLIPRLGENAALFFIIGADAFLEIETWKQYQELPNLVHFVVISRPAYSPGKVGEVIDRNFSGFRYDPAREIWSSSSSKGTFILLHMEPVPISSTEIRDRVRKGKEIKGIVPPVVENYIMRHHLYI